MAAGGGFKQVLVDTGIGTLLADWAQGANFSVLLLAWVLAVLIRLATGSATVATITASALMVGLVEGLGTGEISLVVLAVGAGSVFFSHVNDAGFWLVKEYFGLSVGQTIKSWSLMETVLSVSGLVFVLLLGIVICAEVSAQRHEPVGPVLGDLDSSPRRTTRSMVLRTGTTIRPLVARAGRREAAAATRPRPRPGCGRTGLLRHAEHLRGRGPDRGPVVRRPRQVLGTPLGELRHQLHPDDRSGRPGQVREQRGGPPGPGADVEDVLARLDVEQPQHRRDGPWLGVGLPVADLDRPVMTRPPAVSAGQELRSRDRFMASSTTSMVLTQPRVC